MSRIPQIPEPVPFEFHRGKDKTYTTVYQAVDFPLDHFAIFKQNPVNRDRITEANKMIYSLQKQINELRETVIGLALEMDNNVEKKVQIRIEMGNEVKEVEGSLLKDTYTFTVPAVAFGDANEVSITAKVGGEEEESDVMYLVSSEELSCAEGADVEVKATAQKEEGTITIKKSEEPAPTEDLTFTIKIGDAEATEMSTQDHLTFSATFDAQSADTVITLTASKAGYKLVGSLPEITTESTSVEITVEADETATEVISETITVTQS